MISAFHKNSGYAGAGWRASSAPQVSQSTSRWAGLMRLGLGLRCVALMVVVAWIINGSVSVSRADSFGVNRVWLTQTFQLKAGWSAIFSLVDATHVTLDDLAASNLDIEEIWRWTPEFSNLQFLESPDQPEDSPSNWLVWRRGDSSSSLYRMDGNSAYLVRTKPGATQLQWSVKGTPVVPTYNWKSDGMNLIGFSTVPTGPPTFENFLLPVPRLLNSTPIHRYTGGDLGTGNPLRVANLRSATVQRGEAVWVQASDNQRYYGPIELQLQDLKGIHFGDSLSRYRMTLRNVTTASQTVNATMIASEFVPLGYDFIEGQPTLLIRGELNPETRTFGFETLNSGSPRSWTLAPAGQPGSEITLTIGMQWNSLTGDAGDLNGAVLRVKDAAGQMQYDVAVTARVPDPTGLWVGEATITHVQQELQTFRKSSDQGLVTARVAGDLELIWVKRLPEPEPPADAADTSKWLEIDGYYFRKLPFNYLGAPEGQVLQPPPVDENGVALANPGFYWQARPIHPSFDAGYYYDGTTQRVIANGYQAVVSLQWLKALDVANPPEASFPASQTAEYSPAREDQILEPPTHANLMTNPSYWDSRPHGAPIPPSFQYNAQAGTVESLVTGDLEVIWLKQNAEAATPPDASNTSKWHVSNGGYYLKYPVQYTGLSLFDVLQPPSVDENNEPLEPSDSYWQARPFHPSFALGYAWHSASSQVIATGDLATITLLWLPQGETDPDLGFSQTYTGLLGGSVLLPPSMISIPVGASHWQSMPSGAPLPSPFAFEPQGETYEISADGRYIPVSLNQDMAGVARPMPLRLIFHSGPGISGPQTVRMLQRVYFATDADAALVLANNPQWITETSSPIRRISSAHTPWSAANQPIPCAGNLQFGVTGQINIHHADTIANPFVHAYHPDHDNLDARYEAPLGQGLESFAVRRAFSLTPASEDPSFESLSRSGDTRVGVYEEQIHLDGAGGHTKTYQMRGGYLLRRIVKSSQLLTQ